jgi:hypothetical protein
MRQDSRVASLVRGLLAVGLVSLFAASPAFAGHWGRRGGNGNCFPDPGPGVGQYYSEGPCAPEGTGMYPSPHWVPPHVGHTYYTTPVLAPHAHMHRHWTVAPRTLVWHHGLGVCRPTIYPLAGGRPVVWPQIENVGQP